MQEASFFCFEFGLITNPEGGRKLRENVCKVQLG
jgi:hypothetical protein